MGEENKIDQSELAKDVASKISYEFLDYFLVKPLDPVKVKKEVSKPVSAGKATEDANGVKAQDFDKVETEVIEVDSDFRKAVVIKCPLSYLRQMEDPDSARYLTKINPGDIIFFKDTAGIRFDLLKDSRLVKHFDILGFER